MYIDDNNYDTAIENLDDCIWAINNMLDYTIKPRGFASKEDHKYLEPRFSEANRYIISLLAHPKHNEKFKALHRDKDYAQILSKAMGRLVNTTYQEFADTVNQRY
jgi:hypothetical protein|tara:strand:+ start:949 stop:1263 length:315 start_codon:yes stop_codon:yes gene_type:complete